MYLRKRANRQTNKALQRIYSIPPPPTTTTPYHRCQSDLNEQIVRTRLLQLFCSWLLYTNMINYFRLQTSGWKELDCPFQFLHESLQLKSGSIGREAGPLIHWRSGQSRRCVWSFAGLSASSPCTKRPQSSGSLLCRLCGSAIHEEKKKRRKKKERGRGVESWRTLAGSR